MSVRRRLFALITAVLATLALAWAGGSPAQAAGFTPINIWNSSHCLDNATENAAKLQMWSCTGGAEQNWLRGFNSDTSLYTFTNQNTGRCITAPTSGTGTAVMAICNAAARNQQWALYYAAYTGSSTGWFYIWQNASSGYCLSTPSVGNGTLIQTISCDSTVRYEWWHQP
ncbi:RICIN domain-containing protein [Streptomyces sp. NBC_01478]|uniref:RICIN domain-containing protein n=1 Tax=Streptomyces sp. NBC_01478 TaxID=2903882 RepID=UPI002E3408D0|nr:RICIN domain-containing protein [Streptomyces sp. NBC_01478]